MRRFLVFKGYVVYCSFNKEIYIESGVGCFTVMVDEKEIDLKNAGRRPCFITLDMTDYYGDELWSNGKKYFLVKKGEL